MPTNVVLQSNNFSDAAWTTGGNPLTATSTPGPNGPVDGWTIAETTTTTDQKILATSSIAVSSGATYCFSIHVKQGTGRYVAIGGGSPGLAGTWFVTYDLNTQTATENTVSGTGATNSAHGIKDVGGGWYRIWCAGSVSAATAYFPIFALSDVPTHGGGALGYSYLGTGLTQFIFGAQFETGTVPTTYIETTTVAVTINWPSTAIDDPGARNPTRAWDAQRYVGHTWGQRLALTVPNLMPKRQTEWSNPVIRDQWRGSPAYLGHTWGQRLALTVPNKQPFSQDDWPNPRLLASPAYGALDFITSSNRTALTAPGDPFAQNDWLNPVLRFNPVYLGFVAATPRSLASIYTGTGTATGLGDASAVGATPGTSGSLLFKSAFDSATTLNAIVSGFQNITGTDATSGYAWAPNVFWSELQPGVQCIGTGSEFANSLASLTGPLGGTVNALHLKMTAATGVDQAATLIQPDAPVTEFYYKADIRFDPNIGTLLLTNGVNNWMMVTEYKTGPITPNSAQGDYRATLQIQRDSGGGTLHWRASVDTNANGSGVPLVGLFDSGLVDLSFGIAGGTWYTIEVYTKRSVGADNLIWWAANGEEIARFSGSTTPHDGGIVGNYGINAADINRFFLTNQYTGGNLPQERWITNVEIWDGIPGAPPASGTPFYWPGYNTVRQPVPTRVPYSQAYQGIFDSGLALTTPAPVPFSLYYWPNPVTGWNAAVYQGFSSNSTTLIGPNVPFSQDDWPNLTLPWSTAVYQRWQRGLNLALNVPNTEPFAQDDWPNPIRPWSTAVYQRWQRGLNLALNVANVEPFTQDDWPNPLLRPFAQAYVGTSNNLVTLIGPNVPFSQDDWPNPSARSYTHAYQGFATTQTTTAPPFAPSDWPNPIRPAIPIGGFTQSALALATFVQSPFTQDDWPNPLLRPFAQAYVGFTSTNRLALTIPNVEPFTQDDWPNPTLRLPPIHPVSASNVALPSAVIFVPHNQADWPNPILPVSRAYQGHSVSGLALTVPNKMPFSQDDWPLPTVRTPAVYQGFVLGSIPASAAPFGQDNWPNPGIQLSSAYQWASSPNTVLVPTNPFSQNDWPNSRAPQASYQGFTANATTLIGPNFPRASIDWPNPIIPPQVNRGFVSGGIPFVQAPFSQNDWSTPIIPQSPNRGFGSGGVLVIAVPFSQNDWPNPQSYSARAYQGVISTRVIPTPAPFAQYDWPNPIRPVALGTLLAPINILSLVIESLGAIPFHQLDWPVYRSLRSPIYGFPLHHYNHTAKDHHGKRTYYTLVGTLPPGATVLAGSAAFPPTMSLPADPTVVAASLKPFRKA